MEKSKTGTFVVTNIGYKQNRVTLHEIFSNIDSHPTDDPLQWW